MYLTKTDFKKAVLSAFKGIKTSSNLKFRAGLFASSFPAKVLIPASITATENGVHFNWQTSDIFVDLKMSAEGHFQSLTIKSPSENFHHGLAEFTVTLSKYIKRLQPLLCEEVKKGRPKVAK